MSKRTSKTDGRKSVVRSKVEHVFGHRKVRMGLVIRTIGLARTKAALQVGQLRMPIHTKARGVRRSLQEIRPMHFRRSRSDPNSSAERGESRRSSTEKLTMSYDNTSCARAMPGGMGAALRVVPSEIALHLYLTPLADVRPGDLAAIQTHNRGLPAPAPSGKC